MSLVHNQNNSEIYNCKIKSNLPTHERVIFFAGYQGAMLVMLIKKNAFSLQVSQQQILLFFSEFTTGLDLFF